MKHAENLTGFFIINEQKSGKDYRESEKYTFLISINNMCISLIIKDIFLNRRLEEIIDFFSENNIYQRIRGGESKICTIGEDMVLWPNDPDCQRLKK
ncbi:hypothetical protein VU04_09785 [Desulfobulbus sp. TB]|nr:hypothetical protein [Desulfobulbus sp. TB]